MMYVCIQTLTFDIGVDRFARLTVDGWLRNVGAPRACAYVGVRGPDLRHRRSVFDRFGNYPPISRRRRLRFIDLLDLVTRCN